MIVDRPEVERGAVAREVARVRRRVRALPCIIGRLVRKASIEKVVWTCRSPNRICRSGGAPTACADAPGLSSHPPPGRRSAAWVRSRRELRADPAGLRSRQPARAPAPSFPAARARRAASARPHSPREDRLALLHEGAHALDLILGAAAAQHRCTLLGQRLAPVERLPCPPRSAAHLQQRDGRHRRELESQLVRRRPSACDEWMHLLHQADAERVRPADLPGAQDHVECLIAPDTAREPSRTTPSGDGAEVELRQARSSRPPPPPAGSDTRGGSSSPPPRQ